MNLGNGGQQLEHWSKRLSVDKARVKIFFIYSMKIGYYGTVTFDRKSPTDHERAISIIVGQLVNVRFIFCRGQANTFHVLYVRQKFVLSISLCPECVHFSPALA